MEVSNLEKSKGGNGVSVQVLTAEQKKELYEKSINTINEKLKTLEEGNIVPRMATISAVLKDLMPHYLWCGFYFAEEGEMVIGPYQGSCACPNIKYSGVCGNSALKKGAVIVPNVHDFPGHIVCDERSKSEIVVPLLDNAERVIAVFDVDSHIENAFDAIDKKYLEQIMPILLKGESS